MLPPDSPLFTPVHIVEYDYPDLADAQDFAPPATEQVHTIPMPVVSVATDVLNVSSDVAVISPHAAGSATPDVLNVAVIPPPASGSAAPDVLNEPTNFAFTPPQAAGSATPEGIEPITSKERKKFKAVRVPHKRPRFPVSLMLAYL